MFLDFVTGGRARGRAKRHVAAATTTPEELDVNEFVPGVKERKKEKKKEDRIHLSQ
jgi:hypothetical protein